MYKISPSILEQYRIFRLGIYETPIEEMLDMIQGKFKPRKPMIMGSLIHQFMQYNGDMTKFDASELQPEEIEQLLPISNKLNFGENEVFVVHTIGEFQFRMKVDKLFGNQVHELKTGLKAKTVSDYDDSLQWRLYLLGTGCDIVWYHQITFTEKRPATIKLHPSFSFYNAPRIESEVMEYAIEFVDFCKHHDIEKYITL